MCVNIGWVAGSRLNGEGLDGLVSLYRNIDMFVNLEWVAGSYELIERVYKNIDMIADNIREAYKYMHMLVNIKWVAWSRQPGKVWMDY